MTVVKTGNLITLTLTPEEDVAVDYYMGITNGTILHEFFDNFIQARVKAAPMNKKAEIFKIFESLPLAEQLEFLAKGNP